MLTIEECRAILKSGDLTDKEIERIRSFLYAVVRKTVEVEKAKYKEKRQMSQPR